MMISVYEILGAIFGVAFAMVFLQGIAEKDSRFLFYNFFIGGGGILFSGAPIGGIVYLLFLGIQTWFVLRGDTLWAKGTGIYVGEETSFTNNGVAYEIKVKQGQRYIIVQLRSGKTYYYDGVDEFLCFWEVSEDFYQIRDLLGLTTNAN